MSFKKSCYTLADPGDMASARQRHRSQQLIEQANGVKIDG